MSDTASGGYTSNTDYVAAAACTALLCYDYLICLDREIPLIWTRKLSLTSAFYVLCRYSMMVYTLLTWTPVSDELTCVASSHTRHIFSVLFSPVVTVSELVKVYAVSRCDRRWTFVTIAPSLVPVATNIFLYVKSTFTLAMLPDSLPACVEVRSITHSHLETVVIATRVCAITSYVLVVVAIVFHTRGQCLHAQGLHQHRPTLISLIQRDGFVMFVFLALLTTLAIALDFTVRNGRILTMFLSPAASIIISRGVLKLLAATSNFNLPEDSDDLNTFNLSFVAVGSEQMQTPSDPEASEPTAVHYTTSTLITIMSVILSEGDVPYIGTDTQMGSVSDPEEANEEYIH